MNPISIKLRYSHEPQREPCARFVAGADSAGWLSAISDGGISMHDAKLLIVPMSPTNLTPAGVLVTGTTPTGTVVHRAANGPGSVPYGLVGDRLYVPVEATFSPPVADDEWESLLNRDMAAYVWHPVAGLIGFEADDVRRVSDFIQAPTVRDDDWSHAEAGVVINTRLWSVAGPTLPSADEVLGTGKGNIGTQVDQFGQLMSRPMEKVGQGVRAAVGVALLPLAMLANMVASLLPPRKDASSGVRPAQSGGQSGAKAAGGGDGWAANFLNKVAGLLHARDRQIDKLLHLLQSDPDEGLKFAIPFGGSFGGAFRGLAIPGFSLMKRLVDFTLQGMGGGAAVDLWNIDHDRQVRLVNRYRELAEREIRLGRYRRAAYIYATLLNDLPSAASVLEKGKQYREAAVVYKQKLHRPWEAARCLEQGGMFDEAVNQYEELRAYEKIGDLYMRLAQPDDASAAYQQAVDQFVKQDELLAAATLQEHKLEDVDAALSTLLSGWPHSGQARSCLVESFRLLGRLGRHEAAQQRITSLRGQSLPGDRMPMLVEGLVEAAIHYPDGAVQWLAADAARITTSHGLTHQPINSKLLLDALRRLAPEDRLLERDCHRFQRQAPLKPKSSPAHKRLPGGVVSFTPECVRQHLLPDGILWHVCRMTQRGYYVAGYRENETILIRRAWRDDGDRKNFVSWPTVLVDQAPLQMSVDNTGRVYLAIAGGRSLQRQMLRYIDDVLHSTEAGTIGALNSNVGGFDHTPSGRLWSVELPWMVLKGYEADGTPTMTHSLPLPGDLTSTHRLPIPEVPLHARDDGVFVGIDRWLMGMHKLESNVIEEVDARITSIVGAYPHSRQQAVALHAGGGVMTWRGLSGGPSQKFSCDHEAPVATFLRDGRLIVLGEGGMSIFSTDHEQLQLVAESSRPFPLAIGAAQVPGSKHLAVCTRTGTIDLFELPESKRS